MKSNICLFCVVLALLAISCWADEQCVYEEPPVNEETGKPMNMPGGFSQTDKSDRDEVIRLATKLWNNQLSSSNSFYRLTCLKSAEQQVVAGLNYRIKGTFTRTSCNKSQLASLLDDDTKNDDVEALSNCENMKDQHECSLVIYWRPWGDKEERITKFECDPILENQEM